LLVGRLLSGAIINSNLNEFPVRHTMIHSEKSSLVDSNQIVFLDTNKSILGFVSKKYNDVGKCENLNESVHTIALLGAIISIMYQEESSQLEASLEHSQNNTLAELYLGNVYFNINIDIIGKISEEIEIFQQEELSNIHRINLENISDNELGSIIKKELMSIIKNSKNEYDFRMNVFLGITKLILDKKLVPSFTLRLPVAGHVVKLDFDCSFTPENIH
jgi:hypothetical protein